MSPMTHKRLLVQNSEVTEEGYWVTQSDAFKQKLSNCFGVSHSLSNWWQCAFCRVMWQFGASWNMAFKVLLHILINATRILVTKMTTWKYNLLLQNRKPTSEYNLHQITVTASNSEKTRIPRWSCSIHPKAAGVGRLLRKSVIWKTTNLGMAELSNTIGFFLITDLIL